MAPKKFSKAEAKELILKMKEAGEDYPAIGKALAEHGIVSKRGGGPLASRSGIERILHSRTRSTAARRAPRATAACTKRTLSLEGGINKGSLTAIITLPALTAQQKLDVIAALIEET